MEKAEVLEDEYQHLFLKPLLNASTLLITFQGEAEALTVSINEQGEMKKVSPPQTSNLTFYGNQTEIIDLLHGDISLQHLIQSGSLKVKGSFSPVKTGSHSLADKWIFSEDFKKLKNNKLL